MKATWPPKYCFLFPHPITFARVLKFSALFIYSSVHKCLQRYFKYSVSDLDWGSQHVYAHTWGCAHAEFTVHLEQVLFATSEASWVRPKKEVNHSILVGGSFGKQGNWHTRLALGGCKMSWAPQPPTRILRFYTEALTGFSHVFHPDGPNDALLSQGCVLYEAPGAGKMSRWGSEEPPIARSRQQVTQWPCSVDGHLQQGDS